MGKIIEEKEKYSVYYRDMYYVARGRVDNFWELLQMKNREIDDLEQQLSASTKEVQKEDFREQDNDRREAPKLRSQEKVNPEPDTSKQSKRRKGKKKKSKQGYFSSSSNEST